MPAALPARAPIPGTACPASAYTLECRMLKEYTRALYSLDTDTDALVAQLFGPDLTRRRYESALDRLDEDLPELIRLLRGKEQRTIAALLLDNHDLPGFIQAILTLDRGNGLKKREHDVNLKPTARDESLAKAAGIGHISRDVYGRPQPAKPAPAPVIVPPAPQMVYLLPVAQVQPKVEPRPRPLHRPKYRAANPAQLSLWP